jgi:hypothetical protein
MTFLSDQASIAFVVRKLAAPHGAKVKPGLAASTSLFRVVIRSAYAAKVSMLSFQKKASPIEHRRASGEEGA